MTCYILASDPRSVLTDDQGIFISDTCPFPRKVYNSDLEARRALNIEKQVATHNMKVIEGKIQFERESHKGVSKLLDESSEELTHMLIRQKTMQLNADLVMSSKVHEITCDAHYNIEKIKAL